MKYIVTLFTAFAVAMLIQGTAFASGSIHHNNVLIGGGASSKAVSRATNIQGQNQNMNVTGMGSNFVSTTKHQAPGFGLAALFPTAVCQGTLAGGFSFLLGGGAAAGTITVEECMKLETIRVGVYMMQNAATTAHLNEMANANKEVYCSTKYGGKTTMCGGDREEVVVAEPTPERRVSIDWPWKWFN